jgi:hypothetical protein
MKEKWNITSIQQSGIFQFGKEMIIYAVKIIISEIGENLESLKGEYFGIIDLYNRIIYILSIKSDLIWIWGLGEKNTVVILRKVISYFSKILFRKSLKKNENIYSNLRKISDSIKVI